MHKRLYFDATIRIEGIDRIGMLNDVTRVLSEQMSINIHKVSISCNEGIFEGSIELYVHDREDVRTIIENLKKVPDVQEVTQIM